MQQTRGGLFTLSGHTSSVRCVAFSPDGTRIATGAWDQRKPGEVKMWDARTGTALFELQEHPNVPGINSFIKSVAFSPDGTRIVTGGENNTAKVWDARTGTILLELKGHTTPVLGVAYSPDGTRIVTGGGGQPRTIGNNKVNGVQGPGEVKVWDARTGKPLFDLKGHSGGVSSAAFSPDGTRIVTGGGDMGMPDEVKVWDAAKGGNALFERNGINSEWSTVSYSPDGKWIVTGNGEGSTTILNATTGAIEAKFEGARDTQRVPVSSPDTGTGVMTAAFSPDGTRIVTGVRSGHFPSGAIVRDARTRKELFALTGHTLYVTSAAFSPDGMRIVTGSADGTAKVWDARSGTSALELGEHSGELASVAFSPDGKRMATASIDGTVKLWDRQLGVALELKGVRGSVRSVSFSRDGARILTAGGGGSTAGHATVWDATTGTVLLELKGFKDGVLSAAFSPDGKRIVTGGVQRMTDEGIVGTELIMWDARTGHVLFDLTDSIPPKKVYALGVRGWSVAFSPDGTRFVSGGGASLTDKNKWRKLKVWDAQTGKVLFELDNVEVVQSVAFSPDGKQIVTGGAIHSVKLWDIEKMGSPLLFKGHQGMVQSVAFSPDGKRIVTGSTDKTAKVWDVRSGTALVELRGHTGKVQSVAFSPDGARILTCGGDPGKPGEAYVWDPQTGTVSPELKGDAKPIAAPDADELAYRRLQMQPNFGRYREGYQAARVAENEFAARFYLNLIPVAERTGLVAKADLDALVPLVKLANAHQQAGKWDLAVPLLVKIADVKKAALGPEHPDTLDDMERLGKLYWQMRQLDKAVPVFEEVLKLREAKHGRDDMTTLRTVANLGVNYRAAGRLKEAIPLLEEAQRAANKHKELGFVTAQLLEAYAKAGEKAKRVNLLREIAIAKKDQLGPENPDTNQSMTNLGVAYWEMRQFDKSIPLFEALLKSREAKHGLDHPETLFMKANLGVNYRDADRVNEAIPLLEAAQLAAKKVPDLVWVTMELLNAYEKAGENAKLVCLVREALTEARKVQPPEIPQLAQQLATLGTALLKAKAFGEAEPLLRECLVIREKTQLDAWSTFNTQSSLGGALLGQKKYTEAAPLLLAGYKGMKQREMTIPEQGKVRLPEALDRLVELYTATNKPDEAVKWQAERAKYPEIAPQPREKK